MTDESTGPPLRALIVDDEPLARERIRDLLSDETLLAGPAVEVAGEAEDGDEAIAQIRALDPDLVFLDVQMPGTSGLDVVDAVGASNMPLTVFVTAYDQYALDAFDAAAVDYLLKPFDDNRFAEAVRRARQRHEEQEHRDAARTLRRLLDAHPDAAGEPDSSEDTDAGDAASGDRSGNRSSAYLERIAVQGRGKTRIVPVDAITHVTADGSYAELHTPDDSHLIRERMKTLADRLDPDVFMRIHRSVIVRLDAVEAILRGGGGDYAVRLRTGDRLSLSRNRVDDLENRLGIQ